jgi:hypothetical protein
VAAPTSCFGHIFDPDPPLAKPCVSASAPGYRRDRPPTAEPCVSFCSLRSQRSRHARTFRPCGAQAPHYRSRQSASSTPTRSSLRSLCGPPSPGPSGGPLGPPGHLRWPWRPFGEYLSAIIWPGEYAAALWPRGRGRVPAGKSVPLYLAPTLPTLAAGGRYCGLRRRAGLGLRG